MCLVHPALVVANILGGVGSLLYPTPVIRRLTPCPAAARASGRPIFAPEEPG